MTASLSIADQVGASLASWDKAAIEIAADDGRIVSFNRYWLRDNCPSIGDRASLSRPTSVAELAGDLSISEARVDEDGRVVVEFSDGMQDAFPIEFLTDHGFVAPSRVSTVRPWRAGFEPNRFAFGDLASGSQTHHRLLESVARDGFAIVEGLAADHTERLADLLGPVRETDFGRVFDIITEPDPFTPSQSDAALDPHTDDPYRYSPAGISILHCVAPCSGEGGASTIVDGFAIAEQIRSDDPGAFRLLTGTAIPYTHRRTESVRQADDVHLRAEAPVITIDVSGAVIGIRFHERSMAPLSVFTDDIEGVYKALGAFARAVLGGRFAFEHRLGAGEAFVYDNQRVLHGRAAISGSANRRHLRLCTIDRDQTHSRLRRLRESYNTGSECDPLPAGCLA